MDDQGTTSAQVPVLDDDVAVDNNHQPIPDNAADENNNNNNDTLLKAYRKLVPTISSLDDGAKVSLPELDKARRERRAKVKQQQREKIDAAFQEIKAHRTTAVQRVANALLGLSKDQRRWVILGTTFWISVAMLCVFVGLAIKVDCDNECQREARCNVSLNATSCNRGCILDNWTTSLFGVWMLDALLVLVLIAVGIITLAEKLDVCGGEEKCGSKETFSYPQRIAVSLTSIFLLAGSLFGMLKLSVESGGWGFAFLKTISWQFCFSFGYAAYAIIWFVFLIQLWVFDFQDSSKRAKLKPWLHLLGFVSGVTSSICPLIFFILVGVNVGRDFLNKIDGFKLVVPLFLFFFFRMISALIIPFHDWIYGGWGNEIKTIVRRSLILCGLYVCGVLGLVFSALTIESERLACGRTIVWRWIYAVTPFLFFNFALILFAFVMMVYLLCRPDTAKDAFDGIVMTITELITFDQVAPGGTAGISRASAENLGRASHNSNQAKGNNNNNSEEGDNHQMPTARPSIDYGSANDSTDQNRTSQSLLERVAGPPSNYHSS